MAAKLVGTFLRCALGPVNYAGGCIISSRVADGLRELTPESLHGGVQRGIDEAAKQVGVKRVDVERLLPMGDIRLSAERLGFCQKNALEAWNAHAGQIGGLLSGVAELTVDGRAPDVSLCLERLAKKVIRDKPLSEPLMALSLEVGRWIELVELSASRLEDGGVLARAFRRRRIQQIAAGVVLAVTASGSLGAVLWVRAGRVRVEEVLANSDVCAVTALAEGDRARGSLEQKKRLEERAKDCEVRRAEEEARREEERKEGERRAADEKKKKEREQRCEALAAHVEAGKVLPEDATVVAADGAGLLARIAAGVLDAGDLGPENPKLPCEGTAGGARLGEAFDKAVLAAPSRWANAEEPSERVRETLEKHAAELPGAAKQVVARRADDAAKRALLVGGAQIGKAAKLCKLKAALGLGGGRNCASVGAVVR